MTEGDRTADLEVAETLIERHTDDPEPVDDVPEEQKRQAFLATVARGDGVTWQDRMRMVRHGRVLSVTGTDLHVQTSSGATALVDRTALTGLSKAEVHGEIPNASADRAKAEARFESVRTTRTQGAIVDVYEALAELEPDADPTGLKIRAAKVVRDTAEEAAQRLASDSMTANRVAPTEET